MQAINFLGTSPRIMGIGFVFAESDPYTGIDIDDCRDPQTGNIGAWAQELIDKLDSYTEVSPSGTGVKIIVTASLPGSVRRRNKVEMYSDKRYFTITGEVVGERHEICERQRQLAEVYELAFGQVKVEETPEVPTQDEEKLKRVQAISDDELLSLPGQPRMVKSSNVFGLAR